MKNIKAFGIAAGIILLLIVGAYIYGFRIIDTKDGRFVTIKYSTEDVETERSTNPLTGEEEYCTESISVCKDLDGKVRRVLLTEYSTRTDHDYDFEYDVVEKPETETEIRNNKEAKDLFAKYTARGGT